MNNETRRLIEEFLSRLAKHTERKAVIYDGVNQNRSADFWLRCAIEELGEVATAITRNRLNSAADECIDVAHVALCLYIKLNEVKSDDN